MPLGTIGGFAEMVQWTIPDVLSLVEDPKIDSIESPAFVLAGCRWHLNVCPNGIHGKKYGDYVAIVLSMDDSVSAVKTVTYNYGLRKTNGSLEEGSYPVKKVFGKKFFSDSYWFCSRTELRERESLLLPSGELTIVLRMEDKTLTPETIAPNSQEVESERRMMLVDLETLSSDFNDLFISERKCDVTVNVQGKDFKAHRAVLSARSSVFRAMYDHDTAEEETGALKIPDCDPGTFGEFLSYLYTGKTEEMAFQTAYHLFNTTDKYDVQPMKSFCAHYLKQNLTAQNVCQVVVLADRHSDDELMSSAQVFFNKNFRSVLLTSEWKALSSSCLRLSNKLLEAMAASDLENPSKRCKR